jgi:hypothetical protein
MKKKLELHDIVELSLLIICVSIALFFLVIEPYLIPWIKSLFPVHKQLLMALPEMKLQSKDVTTIIDKSFEYLNKLVGLAGAVIGVLVGVNSLRRRTKAKRRIING